MPTKPMTLETFFTKLAKVKAKWRVTEYGAIRTTSNSRCPVQMVREHLDGLLTARIVNAADYRTHEPTLRRRLLRTLGLKERL